MREEIEDMKKAVQEVQEQNLASSILKEFKNNNKRMFIIVITLIVALFIETCYLIYLINDIGTETTTTTETYDVEQDNDSGNNNFINGNNNEVK